MNLNGLWTVTFISNTNTVGAGVAVLRNGHILGGDSSYYYVGSYNLQGTHFQAEFQINHFHGVLNSIFGPLRSIKLTIRGAANDTLIMAQGFDPAMPTRRLSIRLERAPAQP